MKLKKRVITMGKYLTSCGKNHRKKEKCEMKKKPTYTPVRSTLTVLIELYNKSAVTIQKYWRGFRERRRFKLLKKITIRIQRKFRARVTEILSVPREVLEERIPDNFQFIWLITMRIYAIFKNIRSWLDFLFFIK